MSRRPTIVGSYLSPYVRKVLACLHRKGIDYEIDPIVPFFGGDEFSKVSPLRRIPVLIDGDVTLCDSTVICEYLEERHPEPALYPTWVVDRARARWLEEYADSRMGDVFIWRYFNQLVIKRFVWGEEPDASAVAQATEVEIPQILDHLEGELEGAEGGFVSECGIAEISVAAFFRNAGFAGLQVDGRRWPRLAAFLDRTLQRDCFLALRPFEELSLRTPIERHREALAEAGAPISETSFGTSAPRRGLFKL